MRVEDPRMAAGEIVTRDVQLPMSGSRVVGSEEAIKNGLSELLSLLRNAPGCDTSSDRLRIWIVADGPGAFSIWGVKGDTVGPVVSRDLQLGMLLYDGSFAQFAAEMQVDLVEEWRRGYRG